MKSSEDLHDFVDTHPTALRAWKTLSDEDVMPGLLVAAEVASAASTTRAKQATELWPLGRLWQDAIGTLIRWWIDLGQQAPPRRNASDSQKARAAQEAIDTALAWSALESVSLGVRVGLYDFEPATDGGSFHFIGEPRHEALAHRLYSPTIPDLSRSLDDMRDVAQWYDSSRNSDLTDMPDDVFHATLRIAKRLSEQIPRELDPGVRLPGFTLAEARDLWNVVFGYAYVARFITMISPSGDTAILSPSRDALLADLATRTEHSHDVVESFIDFLTYRSGRHPDPAVAPFVRAGSRVLVSPTLVGMSNFERNLFRLLAYEPSLYGPVASLTGRNGTDRVGRFLEIVDGVRVATNVKVVDGRGVVLGDLDVVAADATSGHYGIFEVKWPAAPDSVEEGTKAEIEIRNGQKKMLDLAERLRSGDASAQLPARFPTVDFGRSQWFVVCGTHISSNQDIVRHAVRAISWQELWRSPTNALSSLLQEMNNDDRLPTDGVDFDLVWDTLPIGPHRFRVQKIRLLP